MQILLPSTLLLYGSTLLFMISLASYISSVGSLINHARLGLYSTSFSAANINAFDSEILTQSWMMTAALAINVRLAHFLLLWTLWTGKELTECCSGPDRRQYRVVARVRSMAAKQTRALLRAVPHRAHIRYVSIAHPLFTVGSRCPIHNND